MTLLYTPGEPAGIGPDLILQLAHQSAPLPLVVADPDLLAARALKLGLAVELHACASLEEFSTDDRRLQVLPVKLAAPATPGRLDATNAGYVLETLRTATALCMEAPDRRALVTGPVHKGVINEAGIPFTGHTEFLAQLTHGTPVMMLACPNLRVALATTHLPLRAVADAITQERLEQVLTILHGDLRRRFGIADPHILVCGLNPHAGEGGHLGTEELEIIAPTLERLRQRGMSLIGPLPADTLFTPRHLKKADAVLAMYHDQGLPVLKHLGFGNAVNITLGLPMVRTSVDHGTALELAGSGEAETGSLRAALDVARKMLSD